MAKRILIVEDEVDLVKVIIVRLVASGYEVDTAYNGKEGVEKAKQVRPDLILLDVKMPGMDGFRVLQELRNNSETKLIPVIMLTGIDDAKSLKMATSLGAIEYITKPFNAEALLHLIGKVIQ